MNVLHVIVLVVLARQCVRKDSAGCCGGMLEMCWS
jgi:hypothetical protein